MLFDLIRTREKGWLLPSHRVMSVQPIRGVLSVDEHQDEALNRVTRLDRFLDMKSGRQIDGVLAWAT